MFLKNLLAFDFAIKCFSKSLLLRKITIIIIMILIIIVIIITIVIIKLIITLGYCLVM